MRRCSIIAVILLLGFASCEPEEPETVYEPAIRLELKELSAHRAAFSVKTIDAESIRYGVTSNGVPELNQQIATGSVKASELTIEIGELEADTDYVLYARGIGPGEEEGKLEQFAFRTSPGAATLYSWERGRSSIPSFADITLVTLGQHNYNPPQWTKERFDSHVRYTDGQGKAHWLFDAFLCIDGYDGKRGLSFSISNGRQSATKESWEDLLEAWLGDDGALKKLDSSVADAAKTLGTPPRPRYVVMSLPDPIMFQYFGNTSSSTTYWGELDGRAMDFSRVEDQQAVYRWYMNRCRSRFNALQFRHLELIGFYILSEELPLAPSFYTECGKSYDAADTWNWQYKRWEQLVPWVAGYAHSCNEGLWWIPYHLAPGYRVWKELGFDNVFMQPNRYWDNGSSSHPIYKTVEALKKFRMGMELEFEYSLVASVMADGRSGPDGSGNPVFYLKDVPLLRDRVREYISGYKDSGLYGVLPLAVYSGTDAMHQLASSPDSGDRAMYEEICDFILQSPLRISH